MRSSKSRPTQSSSPLGSWGDPLWRLGISILTWIEQIDDWWAITIIICAGVVVYARTVFFDFTYFDDHVLILDNLSFLQNIANIPRAFTQEVFHILHASAAYYRPILTLSFMPDAILSARMPGMYHLTNVLIHISASCALYNFLKFLRYRRDLSLFATLIFTVHPVLTQAVAWIPGRNDSLMTVFTLISCTAAIHYAQSRSQRAYVLTVAGFACALFTKETAIIIPLLSIAIILTRGLRDRRIVAWLTSGYVVPTAIWIILRHQALQNPIPMTPMGMVQSMIANSPAAIQLLGKVFFPVNLTVLPIIQDTTFGWGIIATIIVGLIGVSAYLTYGRGERKRAMMMLVGLAWFVLFLFPSFIRPNPAIVADFIEHRLYLPIIGLVIFLLESPLEVLWARHMGTDMRAVVMTSLAILVIVLGLATLGHSGSFSDRLTFWKSAAEGSPHSPLAQRNLGAMYYLAGDLDRADKYFRKSLELNPNEQMANNNLGLIAMRKGAFKVAEDLFRRELAVNPAYDSAFFNLGLLYYRTGRLQEAVDNWKRTLEINPQHEDAARGIAVLERSGALK